jgi:hypothetical protein
MEVKRLIAELTVEGKFEVADAGPVDFNFIFDLIFK